MCESNLLTFGQTIVMFENCLWEASCVIFILHPQENVNQCQFKKIFALFGMKFISPINQKTILDMVYVSPFAFFCRGVLRFLMHFLDTNKTMSQIFDIAKYSYMTCQLQSSQGYLRQTLIFMWDSAQWQWSNLCFSGDFSWWWQNFHLGGRTMHQAIILLISWNPKS